MIAKTMKFGDKLAGDLRAVAASLSILADSIEGATPRDARPPEENSAANTDGVAAATAAEPAKPVTLEDVRAVLAEKSRSGHTAEIRELLLRHGAAKLSEIDPAEYTALLAEAEGIGKEEGNG
jgi:hypothetical protein